METEQVTKVWELIKLATEDFRKCLEQPNVGIDMAQWLRRYSLTKTCVVCLGGAVLYNRFKPYHEGRLGEFHMMDLPDDLKIGSFSARNALYFLNNVRNGDADIIFKRDDLLEYTTIRVSKTPEREAQLEQIYNLSANRQWVKLANALDEFAEMLKSTDE